MPSNLRYSAARTSIISKSPFKSPTKKNQSPIRSLLPGAKSKPILNISKLKESSNLKKKTDDKLMIQDYNVELDFQLSRKQSVMLGIETIVENQWSESSKLVNRYSPKDDLLTKNMEQLVFSLSGLSMKAKADIMKFRQNFPSCLITTNQLYTMFIQEGNTFVDRNIELSLRKGEIRKFVITNAAPIIASTNSGTTGKITYGYENVEVLVIAEDYLKVIDVCKTKAEQPKLVDRFKKFIIDHPTTLFINDNQDFEEKELSYLISLGLVTLTSNHKNEIESQQYAISFPNCGTYLRLINHGRSWLVKALNKSKFYESLESDLLNKWEGMDSNGISKMTNFRKPFYGFDLNWILADAVGSGIVEVFNTPVGRGWKLTGKR